ncbi:MAG: hypothetical protein KGI83_04945 [Verrucomicrobiota bacterium]|nr:hypothetical protein [Verrucomicrobiota bacterium]
MSATVVLLTTGGILVSRTNTQQVGLPFIASGFATFCASCLAWLTEKPPTRSDPSVI